MARSLVVAEASSRAYFLHKRGEVFARFRTIPFGVCAEAFYGEHGQAGVDPLLGKMGDEIRHFEHVVHFIEEIRKFASGFV